MKAERWEKVDELLDATLEVSPQERERFLIESCDGDEDLRLEVLSLLKAGEKADAFLENSAINVLAKELAAEKSKTTHDSLIGREIGTYKIERPLGSGGMGEVYLAHDRKLNRKVALKILPAEFVADNERVKRFAREARAVSALNHPNIVTIYDVGAAEGLNFIATEFVEGKTIRELIGGGLKLEEILTIAVQTAEALDAAHAANVVHRDVKPENIMLRPDGYVKILDFGLAKLTEPLDAANSFSHSQTAAGAVMGTLSYMSPEQATGEATDHRTDVWSLGVVIYEMATGKTPFKSENRQATFNAILSSDPDLASDSNPRLPAQLDRILNRALEKDPELRYQTASDFRAELKLLQRELDSSPLLLGVKRTERAEEEKLAARSKLRDYALAAILLVLAGAGIWFAAARSGSSLKAWDAPDWTKAANTQLTDQAGTEYFPSLAPDGKSFAFAGGKTGRLDVFVQRVGGKKPENLTEDSPADDTQPAFAPDGERIAFRSEREPKGIYVMGATGENPRRVADFGFHPSWSPTGKEIVVSTFGRDQPDVRANGENGLWIINVETGAKRELIKAEASLPAWSPSGKRIAYWFYTVGFGRRDIATVSANGGEPVVVTKDFDVSNWNPVWSPDNKFLYFVSGRSGNPNFWRVRIDEASGKMLGEPEPISAPSKYSRHLNFSRDGKKMIYVQTNNQSNIQAAEFDSEAEKIVGEPFWVTRGDREITRAELSPDGNRFLMRSIRRTQDDIVTVDRDGADWRDVTNDAPFDRYPRWSPDGKQIAFNSDRNRGGEIWLCSADGTNLRQITFHYAPNSASSFPIWSPDGKRLAYQNAGTHVLDLSKSWQDQTAQKLLPLGNNAVFTAWDWSPDGKKLGGTIVESGVRFLAFYSFETNGYTKIAATADYAIPSWLPDSRRMVYATGDKVFLVDSETKKIKELVSSSAEQLRSPFVSRDGRLLYYAAHSSENDIWLLNVE